MKLKNKYHVVTFSVGENRFSGVVLATTLDKARKSIQKSLKERHNLDISLENIESEYSMAVDQNGVIFLGDMFGLKFL